MAQSSPSKRAFKLVQDSRIFSNFTHVLCHQHIFYNPSVLILWDGCSMQLNQRYFTFMHLASANNRLEYHAASFVQYIHFYFTMTLLFITTSVMDWTCLPASCSHFSMAPQTFHYKCIISFILLPKTSEPSKLQSTVLSDSRLQLSYCLKWIKYSSLCERMLAAIVEQINTASDELSQRRTFILFLFTVMHSNSTLLNIESILVSLLIIMDDTGLSFGKTRTFNSCHVVQCWRRGHLCWKRGKNHIVSLIQEASYHSITCLSSPSVWWHCSAHNIHHSYLMYSLGINWRRRRHFRYKRRKNGSVSLIQKESYHTIT